MQSTEIWKPVIGYEGSYEVSNFGNVRGLPRINNVGKRVQGRVLQQATLANGYRQVSLSKAGQVSPRAVHRLVLTAFAGECPPHMEACHGNGVRDDNRLANLRWDTAQANAYDSLEHGTHRGAAKSHCDSGHEFNAENTITRIRRGREHRKCRECANSRNRSYRARIKSKEETT